MTTSTNTQIQRHGGSVNTTALCLSHERLQNLMDALVAAGYALVGPTVQDGAIVYRPISNISELPQGVTTTQAPGEYRVTFEGRSRRFAWANGPQALKPQLFAPQEVLWRARRDAGGHLEFLPAYPESRRLAVIGARACDLAALELQDKHFLRSAHSDPQYARRRNGLFIVAVNCSHPASTCFCASTGDGPTVARGYDIALTELDQAYVASAGSERGAAILAALDLGPATAAQVEQAAEQGRQSVQAQSRSLPGRNLRAALFANLEHPHWEEVAQRCLSCGNCTAVCPTCFCHAENEVPALDGASTEHRREWDSCFGSVHSYMHGFVVRPDTRMRYRQWLTHKLGSWHDQYARSGCVGCGRCIAWCPAGIDITEEAKAICGEKI